MKKLKLLEILILIVLVSIGLWVRLYKIDSPIADWHSWRQADTAAVTRNFIKQGFNPLMPKFDDMSGISEVPIPNLGGFRFVEFPIYNIFVYPFYLIFGVNETYHRLVSILFSLGSIVFIYFITKKYVDSLTAFFAGLIFALLPFNIFFSRTTLPEPTFVFFSLGMIYFVDKWIWEEKKCQGILGFIFTVSAFLMKPWAIFFVPPLLYSTFTKERKLWPVPIKYVIFAILSILPFIFWRAWILQYPEGIPASTWLFNGDNIRFRPAFWWWIISERIGREILGVTGAFFFFLGMLIKPKNGSYFLHFWVLGHFLFFAVVATGNVRHDYYQTTFIPIAAILTAIGLVSLLRGTSFLIPRILSIPVALLFFILMLYFTWKQVVGLYQINNYPIVEAGKEADRLLPKEAIVVAPYNGDTAFLYQTNRQGWPVTAFPLKKLIADYGVTHLISTAKDAKTAWAMKNFQVLEDRPDFVIIDLTHPGINFKLNDPEP